MNKEEKDIDKKQMEEYNKTPPDYISEDGGKFWFGEGCPKIKSYIFFEENKKEDTEEEINNG